MKKAENRQRFLSVVSSDLGGDLVDKVVEPSGVTSVTVRDFLVPGTSKAFTRPFWIPQRFISL